MNEKFLEEALQAVKSGQKSINDQFAIIASGRSKLKEGDLMLAATMQLGAFTKAQALAQIALVQAQQDLVRQQQIANVIALGAVRDSLPARLVENLDDAIGSITYTESEAQK